MYALRILVGGCAALILFISDLILMLGSRLTRLHPLPVLLLRPTFIKDDEGHPNPDVNSRSLHRDEGHHTN